MSPLLQTFANGSALGYRSRGAAAGTSFESIATVTVGSGGATTIDFNNIPQTYTHLQLRTFARRGGTGGSTGINATFNGDTNTNYGQHYIEADGSTAAAGNNVPLSLFGIVDISGGSTTANVFAVGVADILDYTNTNKYKTVRGLTGVDTNGAGGITFRSGLWRSTSAITSMSLTVTSGFAQYSHFALYGIKVAS